MHFQYADFLFLSLEARYGYVLSTHLWIGEISAFLLRNKYIISILFYTLGR